MEALRSALDPPVVRTVLRTQDPVPEGEIKAEMLVLVVMMDRMMGWTDNPTA